MGPQGWYARERGTLWVCDLEQVPLSHVLPRCAATFQEIDAAMCEQLATVMGLTRSGLVLARLQSGRRCFVALVGEAIVSYAWVSHDCEGVGELERGFVLPRGAHYVWDCATVPAYRGRRLYTALLSHILSRLREEGVRRAWIGASRANRPSIRGIVLAGFLPVVSTYYLRLRSVRTLWVSSHPQASPTFIADAVSMLTQPYERRLGPLLVSLGAPFVQPCGAG